MISSYSVVESYGYKSQHHSTYCISSYVVDRTGLVLLVGEEARASWSARDDLLGE